MMTLQNLLVFLLLLNGHHGGLVVTFECYNYKGWLWISNLTFESHVHRAFEFISEKKYQRNELLRAICSVGKRDWTRIDEGRKG